MNGPPVRRAPARSYTGGASRVADVASVIIDAGQGSRKAAPTALCQAHAKDMY